MEKIHLPKELYDKLEISVNEEVEVVDIDEDSFTVRALHPKKEEYAARWFLVPTVISTLIFLILVFSLGSWGMLIPLSGNNSLATVLITVANAVAILTFITAYFTHRQSFYQSMTKQIYWRTFVTVVVSLVLITTLALMALFWFFGQIFHGVQFGVFTSALIFAILSAILNYFVIFVVDTFSIRMMVNMLLMVSIGGLVSSMATNGDQYWWQRNFSLLGTSQSHASLQFNLTLIVSAALLVALIDYIFVSIRRKFGWSTRHLIFQTLMSLCAISIGFVGLIPNNPGWTHVAHDIAAQLIVLFMALSILGIRWFLPKAGANLHRMSYIIGVLLLVCYFLWHPIHYLTLTAFEILSFSLGFAWLLLMVNTLIRMLWDERKVYKVAISAPSTEETKKSAEN